MFQYNTKAGVARTFYVTLATISGSPAIVTSATIEAGDFKISKDGGDFVNLTNTPTVTGGTGTERLVQIDLTASELTATYIVVMGVDSATKEWMDIDIHITTDLLQSDISAISGSTSAADNMKETAESMIQFTVSDASFTPTTQSFEVSEVLTSENGQFKDRVVIFLSGSLKRQAKRITSYDVANKRFFVEELTSAPSNGDIGIVV